MLKSCRPTLTEFTLKKQVSEPQFIVNENVGEPTAATMALQAEGGSP